MSLIGLAFEGAVALVLVLVAGLCWRLDRRLSALRSGQDGVRATVVELAEATAKAEAAVRGLRATSDKAGRDLDERISEARALADELRLIADSVGPERASARDERRAPRAEIEVREETRAGGRAARRARVDPPDDGGKAILARLRGVR